MAGSELAKLTGANAFLAFQDLLDPRRTVPWAELLGPGRTADKWRSTFPAFFDPTVRDNWIASRGGAVHPDTGRVSVADLPLVGIDFGSPGSFAALNPRGGHMADLGLGFMALPPGSAGSSTSFGGFGDALLNLATLGGNFFLANQAQQQFQNPGLPPGVTPAQFQGQSMLGCPPPRVARVTSEVRPDPCGKSPRIWMDVGSVATALPKKAFAFHKQINALAKKAARPARRKRGRR